MNYETILVEREDNIAIIRFNRPKSLNAINDTMLMEIGDAVDEISRDSSIKVLIFTGAGDKAFIAGADIAHMENFGPLQALEMAKRGQDLFLRIERLLIVAEI